MPSLFAPSRALMNRLSVPQKFALIGFVVLAVIAGVSAMLLQRINGDLAFSQQEQFAPSLVRPARALVQAVQRHRGLSQQALAGGQVADKLAAAATEVEAALAAGDSAHSGAAGSLGTAPAWKALREHWIALKGAQTSLDAPASFSRHSALVDETLGFISLAADKTNATLDPEVASYYLMDAFVFRSLPIAEELGKARARATAAVQQKKIDPDGRMALRISQALAGRDVMALRDGLDKAVAAEPGLKAALAPGLSALDAGKKAFLPHIDAAAAGDLGAAPEQVWQSGTVAVDATFAVFDATAGEFDRLIGARIQRLERARLLAFSLIAGGVLLALYLFMGFRQGLLGAVQEIRITAQRIASGDLGHDARIHSRDELGAIGQALNLMRRQLAESIERDRAVATENLRIRNALDKASVSVMLADAEGTIIYCNESVIRMLSGVESELRKVLPQFRAHDIVGRSFDEFHRNPSHQRNLLGGLRGAHQTQIEVGPLAFRLTANPVFDAQGTRLGTVVEWVNRTAERDFEVELARVLGAAAAGDFSTPMPTAGLTGFFGDVAGRLNQLIGLVSDSIEEVARVLNAVASGDLTDQVRSDYQGIFARLKNDTNATVDQLAGLVGRIREATDAVNTAAQEIASGNADLSSRTEEQASSLEETASSMEQLNSTVRQNADNAAQAQTLAAESNDVVRRGGEQVRDVVATMDAIQASASKIADIIGVIDSIAFQTNILALNAAVEAARAGEQGRGFAVVASEVRALAQRSAQAAKEIKGLIGESLDKVEGGARQVRDAGSTIEAVVASFQRLAHLVSEIAHASREQATGIEQVSEAVGQMDEVTQQNAALVEEAAAAAESLEDQARALQGLMAAFRVAGAGQPSGGLAGFDFDAAMRAHLQWKQKLREHLAGRGESLDAAVVERDNACVLGKWIHGEGAATCGHLQRFGGLRQKHADFHRCAGEVVRRVKSGDKSGAEALLHGDFATLSETTVAEIRALRSECQSAPAPRAARSAPAPARAPSAAPRAGAPAAPRAVAAGSDWEEF